MGVPTWMPAPSPPPRLAEDVVDVWRADLATAGERERTLLSPEEQQRAERFARPEDGVRWGRAHGILRALLAGYAGREDDPRVLCFAAGPHGKPALAGGHEAVRFNLSHSGDVALFAFARGREVGVDVELPRRPLDTLAIAERALGPVEADRLRALEPVAREREFLRAWVRYEAVLKCAGTGIGAAGRVEHGAPEPWLCELDVGAPAAAALAVAGAVCAVRCWEWGGS